MTIARSLCAGDRGPCGWTPLSTENTEPGWPYSSRQESHLNNSAHSPAPAVSPAQPPPAPRGDSRALLRARRWWTGQYFVVHVWN